MFNKLLSRLALVTLFSLTTTAQAEKFTLPPSTVGVVGSVKMIEAIDSDTIADLAQQYGIGYEAMVNANPNVDEWYPGAGTKIFIPSRYVLPDAPREGIVLNLPEMRLYYYDRNEPAVYVYAVGIGRVDWQTPLGVLHISDKEANPTWTPPASIRAEHAARGDILPAVVQPGPDNPLGLYKMRLSNPSYLIHGTNKPTGVGMRVSHGCIRMYDEGIEELFSIAPRGVKVNIINQPMKVGWFGDSLYLEFHPPLEEFNVSLQESIYLARQSVYQQLAHSGYRVADELIDAVVREASGMPVEVAYQ